MDEDHRTGGGLPPPPPGTAPAGADPGAPPLDFETACAEFGNPALVAATIRLFIEDTRDRLPRMALALECGDLEAVRREAHRLRGAAGTLEAAPMAAAARSLERHGKDAAACTAGLEALRREFASVEAYVEGHREAWTRSL